LTRFLGLHSMKKGSEKEIHFAVMANVFDSPISIHQQYDLKGSTIGRHVETLDGVPDPSLALKDNDFNRKIKVGTKLKAMLLEQIESDVKLMEQQSLCDYSLLVGLHFLSPEEQQNLLNPQVQQLYCPTSNSLWTQDFGGVLSEDKAELYFLGIIDNLTNWDFRKMSEHFAKSFFQDSTQISAIRPTAYRIRFQKYVNNILE